MKICADVYVESVVDFALTAAGLKSYTCAASEFVDIYLRPVSRDIWDTKYDNYKYSEQKETLLNSKSLQTLHYK